MKLTFLSDTHSFQIPKIDLLGGDILIHSGDISNRGLSKEIEDFLEWMSSLDYEHKVFIAGNHDFMFEDSPQKAIEILSKYPDIVYLQDSGIEINGIKIWGSPWQPFFYDWAFNLPRNGEELLSKWKMIPGNTDILITHGPPHGILDHLPNGFHCGCEILFDEVTKYINPKIHVFGHIHNGYGILEINGTTYINASNLNENYRYSNKPINILMDDDKNIQII